MKSLLGCQALMPSLHGCHAVMTLLHGCHSLEFLGAGRCSGTHRCGHFVSGRREGRGDRGVKGRSLQVKTHLGRRKQRQHRLDSSSVRHDVGELLAHGNEASVTCHGSFVVDRPTGHHRGRINDPVLGPCLRVSLNVGRHRSELRLELIRRSDSGVERLPSLHGGHRPLAGECSCSRHLDET